jgi:mRNA interferase YafQ
MKKAKYTVKVTGAFKKDYKLAMKRGLQIALLDEAITALALGETLPENYKDHPLTGNWVGHRECHIQPDWLLIYRVEDDTLVLVLTRTGSHSDLFGK